MRRMYRFQYGVVILDVTTVNSWDERPEMTDDGVDKKWTRIEGNLSTVWSPWTNGTTPSAGISTPGAAAKVIAALRRLLEEPRKQLIFSIPDNTSGPGNTNVLLMSPLNRPALAVVGANTPYPCDANNGPKIEVLAIKEMQGEVTMVVDIKFVTWINESSSVRRTVSNRWSQIEELDPCFWSRRITSGVAYFRADALRVGGVAGTTLLSPDQFREDALPPVPRGFQRRAIRCEVGSDGLSLSYQVVDEQCALLIVNRKIARIHGYYGDSYTPGNMLAGARAAISSVSGLAAFLRASGEAGTRVTSSIGAHAAREGQGGIGTIGLIAADLVLAGLEPGVFPFNVVTLHLRVDGRPDATREDLVNALSRMAALTPFRGRTFATVLQNSFILANDLRISLDDDALWAEYTLQFRDVLPAASGMGIIGQAPRASIGPLFATVVDPSRVPAPDLNGLGDPVNPNGMVAVVPNQLGIKASGSGTPPSIDPTRNEIVTAFLRAPDFKGTEDPAKTITNTIMQRTNVPPGDSKQLASS